MKNIAKLFCFSVDEEDSIFGGTVITLTIVIFVTFVVGSVCVRMCGSAALIAAAELSSARVVVQIRQIARIKTKEATRFILSETFL